MGNNVIKYIFLGIVLILSISTTVNAAKCADFKTQAEAQAYFIKHRAKRLDRDGDGKACDCLPGGSGKKCPKKK